MLNFKIGIGIHSGTVTLGTLGGKERMDTTVIGNAVGIAKKIESMTKSFSVPIIISSDTYSVLTRELKDDSREIEHLRVGGNNGFITVYEYFGSDNPTIYEKKKAISSEYFRALTLYRAGFMQKAQDLFVHCQSLLPDDSIFSLYINRCKDSLLGNADPDPAPNINKPLALITDSNISFAEELESILKKEKLDTIIATKEDDIASILENMKPSLLFINFDKPEMEGLKLIDTVKKNLNLSKEDCYIIAITSEDSAEKKTFIYDSGADDFIIKPIHIESLKQIIRRVLQS